MSVTAPVIRPEYSPADKVASNKRQQAKLSWKRRQMTELAELIRSEVEKAGVQLPGTPADYDRSVWQQLELHGYDISDGFKEAWNEQHGELIKLYYSIKRTNKAVYAVFESGGVVKPMLLSAWYNKHRFDMVWLWRKSQLIRNIYREYLTANPHLLKNTHPVHMVLTVPHPDGIFAGKKFYAREILQFFWEMRRCPYWKKHVHGGEYGLEIKKSKTNGLHIHVHSLLFLNKTVTVNEFRAWLRDKWQDLTGGCMIHAETLYYYKRKDNGQYITEQVRKKNKHGEWEDINSLEVVPSSEGYNQETGEWETVEEHFKPVPVERRKKHYITEKSTIDEYLQGVLECIKYHFKHDACEDENGNWDLQLMTEILNNSRRLRFYSRFGAFYKEKSLCFDRLEAEPDSIEGAEIELNGDGSRAERELVNPFTFEPAQKEDYGLFISTPEWLKYTGKNDWQPYTLVTYGQDNFIPVQDGFTLKEIIGSMCRGEIWRVLKHGWRSKAA
jgi:hypothetical protein